MKRAEGGYTLVELLISFVVLTILALTLGDLFVSLTHSALVAKRGSVATALAVNQMEYLKSLPYNNLAIAGGSITAPSYIPGTATKKVNGDTYTVITNISYVDDAYDGCGAYPTQAIKLQYCRNYPPPTGAPTTDTAPYDYKDVNVTIKDRSGNKLAAIDTDISALVAETGGNTGSLFVKVVDSDGNPIEGATVQAVDNSVSPAVNLSDVTDQNGIVIFYSATPDNNNNYVISASESGYSSLSTIAISGSLQPTYPNVKLIAQGSSLVTMTLNPEVNNSLVLETTDVNGSPVPSVKVYVKGGYKKYTSSSDTQYYYDTVANGPSPTTDAGGLTGLSGLVPGNYIFCGDAGATGCSSGSTTYYLAAAVPYGGTNSFYPVTVPANDPDNPPAASYSYGTNNYVQKVRLLLSTSSNFPRISTVSPFDVSLTGGAASNFIFSVTGANLPCNAMASRCTTSVKLLQGGTTYTASCTGGSGTQLSCSVNLSTATAGQLQLVVAANGFTFTLPPAPLLGGIDVTP